MRITADVVLRARAFINPIKDRELDLRGYKIPLIENLGTTQDQFDMIDLSDNEIKRLDNFPRLKRLKTLLLSNNFISRIGADVGEQVAGLECLVLTNNKIASLSELDHLAGLKHLTSLSLLDNPVVRQQHYRAYVINRVPSLKVLDFSKVKLEERKTAAKLFRSEAGRKLEAAVAQEGQALAAEADAEQHGNANGKGALTDEQKRIAAAMIDSAKTPEELDRVERMLKAGVFRLPEGVSLPSAAPEPVAAPAPAPPAAPVRAPPAAPVRAPPAPAPAPAAPKPAQPAPAAPKPAPPAPAPVFAPPAPAPAASKPAPAPPAPAPPAAPAKAVSAPPPPVQAVEEEEQPMDVDDGPADGNGGSAEQGLTEDQIAKMKVVELKEELKKLGLPVNGLKQDLLERLRAHLRGT